MSGSKERMTTLLRVVVSRENSHRWRWWKILSQDHIKQCPFVVKREKEIKERSTKEKGREEGSVDEDGEESRIRSQIEQEVVAGIKEKVSVHSGEAVQKPVGQGVTRSWDCSQMENEEEEESWQEGDQMTAQSDAEQKLDEIVQRRRIDGSFLKLEVMQKVQLVVQERRSQGKGVKGLKEKKKNQDALSKR